MGPTTYEVSFHRVLQSVICAVMGCPEVAHIEGWLREHFVYRHFWLQVAVVQVGAETLPCCDLCIMHMPVGRLIKYWHMARCNKNMQMRWYRRDVAISNKCLEAPFSLTREDGAERVDGVDSFRYLGQIPNQSDNDCPAVFRKI